MPPFYKWQYPLLRMHELNTYVDFYSTSTFRRNNNLSEIHFSGFNVCRTGV